MCQLKHRRFCITAFQVFSTHLGNVKAVSDVELIVLVGRNLVENVDGNPSDCGIDELDVMVRMI